VRRLASSAARRGQLTKAGRLLWDLVAADPRDREMQLALVSVMMQRDQPNAALALLEEALAEFPDDAQIAERKAFTLAHLGRLDDALEIYSRLIARHSSVPPLLVARGNILLALGRQESAIGDYHGAISCDPRYGEAWWALANIKTFSLSPHDVNQMSRLLADPTLTPASRINFSFALGKALEDAGLPEPSFAHYRNANELQSLGAVTAVEATREHVDNVIDGFDANNFAGRKGHPSQAPIFVVGMPRSGTTLVEQILASHPDVEATSELPTISAIAHSLGEGLGRSELDYWGLLDGYSDEALKTLGDRYLRQSAAYRRTERPFFIDKMPSNWMHLGLIRLILPNARIIDVRRNPLDCCFSNFAQNYPRGHEFTHRLEDLGTHYRNYERLMEHFDTVSPGTTIRVEYEQLVERPDEIIHALIARLGLPFADSCLRFFENARPVRTPSAQQVRQPMNRRGIGRWRPYAPWLGPLMSALSANASSPDVKPA
jgi:tetratricopeptide (TPR) repeat protein